VEDFITTAALGNRGYVITFGRDAIVMF